MTVRIALPKVGFAVSLFVIIAAGLLFNLSQVTPASAASHAALGKLLPGFRESVYGRTYTWQEVTPWYTTAATRRVDTGTWQVRENGHLMGVINVGINEFTTGLGHPGWAIDTTSSIKGLGIPHETTYSSYPGEGAAQHESAWGFADRLYSQTRSGIISPNTGVLPHQLDFANGSAAIPMFNNMQHQIALQNHAYSKMENVYKAGAKGVFQGGGERDAGSTMNVVHPALVFPLSVYLLAGAGLMLAFGGSIINQVCSRNHCGKYSEAFAIIGGIAMAVGTVLTFLSGYSKSGVAIRLGQLAADALTEGTQSAASAERMVELGARFASSRAAAGIPGDIAAAIPLIRASSI